MIVYYGRIDISASPFSDVPDIVNYRQMAMASPGLDETVSRNFGYRILMPYIAGLMPFDVDMSFYILTILMSLAIPFIFFRFLKVYGLKEENAFYLTLLFLAGRYVFGYPAWNYYDVNDLLTHILILLFFISLKKDKFFSMGLILAVGVVNRETILFIVPPALFYYAVIHKDRKKSLKFVSSFMPAVLILILIRSLIITESADTPGIIHSLGKLRFDDTNKIFNPATYYRLVNTFIPLTFIPLVFFKTARSFFRKNPHFLIFVIIYFASCFLAGDTERLIVPMFPVFFLLIGIIFEKYGFYELKARIIVLFACLVSIPHHQYFRFRLPGRDWKVVISLITLLFVTAYLYKFKKDKINALDNNPDL
jgi:hypothetical protein